MDWFGPRTVSAAYCPLNYLPTKKLFVDYFNGLGNRFIGDGDFNAKHTSWGSRLSPPGRGKILCQVMKEIRLDHLSIYKPTYKPDLPILIKFQTAWTFLL